MVEFELGSALFAGLAGTVAMTTVMSAGRSMGMTRLDMPLLIGGMVAGDDDRARRLGMGVHILMGTVVFGIAYAALFTAFDSDSAGVGALIGLAHGVVLGLVALPMMGTVHPRMRTVPAGPRLDAPGVMGVGYGKGTPVGLLMTHLVYGLVTAIVYGGLV